MGTGRPVCGRFLVGIALAFAVQGRVAASGADDGVSGRDRSPPVELERKAIEEIVVTARRRDEAAQDVPLALSVHSGEELDATGSWSLDRLQRLDATLNVFGFNARTTNISIRRLGGNVGLASDGLENGVGVFVDDVYLGRTGPALFELVDLDRVEVLRGPQDILFGRNTTAGVISLVTRPPTLDHGEAVMQASIGDYGFRQVKASVSGPVWGEAVAARLSLSDTGRNGFIENVHTGDRLQDFDNLTVRGQLLAVPTKELEIRLVGEYAEQETACCTTMGIGAFDEFDDGTPYTNNFLARTERLGYEPLPFVPFDRKVDVDAPVRADMDQWGISLHVDWSLQGFALTSITAYREWNWQPQNDLDHTGLPVLVVAQTGNRQRQLSQELRLVSRGDRRVDYVAGAYHFEEVVDGFGAFAFGPAAPEWFFPPESPLSRAVIEVAMDGFGSASTSSAETRSNALFGQGIWHVSDALDLSAGLRFTSEHRTGRFEQHHVAGASLAGLTQEEADVAASLRNGASPETSYTSRVEDDTVSGALTLSYATQLGTSYVTASLAHKAGGLNVGNLPPGVAAAVEPETVHHYEIGAKTRLFDGTAAVDVAVFRTSVSDYQTSVIQGNASGGRLFEYISNIDEVVSQGFEIETAWSAGDHFEVSAGVAYADAEYVSYPGGPCPVEVSLPPTHCDLSGQPLAGAPEVSWTLALAGLESLDRGVDFYWHLDYSHQSSLFTNVSNSRYSRVGSYGLSNLSVGARWGEGRWDLGLWVRNLFDEDYFQLTNGLSTGLVVGVPGDPRTVGVTAIARY